MEFYLKQLAQFILMPSFLIFKSLKMFIFNKQINKKKYSSEQQKYTDYFNLKFTENIVLNMRFFINV